ncbi:amidase [Reyranella sp.]|uniref:amidase n=1 Tax=Reyranella sp. TaxID=1929291 RepID=UPI00272F09B8|nr:amidase [Reyranella sp.]MDP2373492.1 amidase [Reyranella sp.]
MTVTDFGAFIPGPWTEIPPLGSGALDGLTFVVKDLIDVAGTITGGGNPDWHGQQQPAETSAVVVERFLRAGAAMVGKTVTDELAFSLEGENEHYGTPVNPRCPDRLPGGSSSGSAVAVAAGLVDLGLGTDTGGSVRVPASFCGLYGWRPTHGRVPMTGIIPFAPSFDTVGLFARDATHLMAGACALLQTRPAEKRPVRLLLAADAFALADPEAQAPLREAAARLGGATKVEIYGGRTPEYFEAYTTLQGLDVMRSLGVFLESNPRFGATIAPRFEGARALDPVVEPQWRAWRRELAGRMHALLPPATMLLLPTTPGIAPLRFLRDAHAERFYQAALTLCSVAGLAGLPVVNLPLATLDGCPLGLSVLAGPGEDEALLAFVTSIAAAFPA